MLTGNKGEWSEIYALFKLLGDTVLYPGNENIERISIVIHDQRTNQEPTLGFSIKSQLGSPSTILNASKTTNFTYRIKT